MVPPELRLNWALTVVFALIVKEQEPVPVQVPPLQPAKVLPAAGLAISVTVDPGANDSVQVAPQLMAPPDRVTVPVPVPILAIESTPTGFAVNVAMTFLWALMVTVQVPVPEQSPDHPEKL